MGCMSRDHPFFLGNILRKGSLTLFTIEYAKIFRYHTFSILIYY